MDIDLIGSRSYVTGASRGIGRAIAVALAAAGSDVALAARDVSLLTETASEVEALGRMAVVAPCDVADREQIDASVSAAADGLGGIDIVINGAGIAPGAPAEELDRAMWDQVLDVNLRGSFEVAQAAHPHLASSGGGSVVNVGSAYSIFGSPYSAAYAASKGGVIQLTRSLAISWADDGIRVNAVVPGWIVSDMTEPALTIPSLREEIESRTPFGRFGTPEEVASVVVFLVSGAAGFVTGASIVVDGGYSIT